MSDLPPVHRNLWELTVLCLLRERPLHPYEMQRLIRERKKDDFLDLKRGSLYHAIGRLQRAGLIVSIGTSREGRRPERTVYRLTEEGGRAVLDWLRELLGKPAREPSQFFAAISYLGHLPPDEAVQQLEGRARLLESEIRATDAVLRELEPRIGRLVLLESDYLLAMKRAELAWIRSLVEEVRAGGLGWDPAALLRISQAAQEPEPGKPESVPRGRGGRKPVKARKV
jgi:DNA-binding PadR family transcriptional regulator